MARTFLVGVKGESFRNDDGTSRQDIIRRLRPGQPVRLLADPTNTHDRWAVKVLTENGEQIGWLPSDARDADGILKGEPISAQIHAINGGTTWWKRLQGKKHVGVVLKVTKDEPDWNRCRWLEAKAQLYDQRITEALEAEKKGETEAAIDAYYSVIDEVRTLTSKDPHVSAHRRMAAPVERLSLLLERRKLYKESLQVIEEWLTTPDPVQPSKTARDTIMKRRDRLREKMA